MDPLSALFALGSALGVVLAALNIRDKLWPAPTKPHPLAAPLYEIAAAIRESGGDGDEARS